MKPIHNWDSIKPAGNIETLPAGAYICEIKQAQEVPNRKGSGKHLEIQFDVCEGQYIGFFTRDYRAQNRDNKFWRGVKSENCPNESAPPETYAQQCGFFKRFTNSVEDSNPGYHWDWNEAGLKGKKIGVIMREEERRSQRGTLYTITRADSIIPVEDVRSGNFKVPPLKMLKDEFSPGGGDLIPPPGDDDLPFD